MMTDTVTLSPSDLTFLWSECPRCFYLKYKLQIKRPSAPFPSIFGKIDLLMKGYFAERPAAGNRGGEQQRHLPAAQAAGDLPGRRLPAFVFPHLHPA